MSDSSFFPEPILDKDLLLRIPSYRDINILVEACNEFFIARYTSVPVPYLTSHARTFVEHAKKLATSAEGLHLLSVLDNQVVGCVGATIRSNHKTVEIGYWVVKEARGQNVAFRSALLLCKYLFEHTDTLRIDLKAAVENTASNRVAQKLGFTLEGTLRQSVLLSKVGSSPAKHVDMNLYGLLRGELLA